MNRAPGLDLLRAAAIVWVMYYHAQIMLAGGALLYWAVERPFLRLRERLPRTSHRAGVLAEA